MGDANPVSFAQYCLEDEPDHHHVSVDICGTPTDLDFKHFQMAMIGFLQLYMHAYHPSHEHENHAKH